MLICIDIVDMGDEGYVNIFPCALTREEESIASLFSLLVEASLYLVLMNSLGKPYPLLNFII